MNSKDRICAYIQELMFQPMDAVLDLEKLEKDDQELGKGLLQLSELLSSLLQSLIHITDGVLTEEIVGKTPYAGALKDLQSSLKHMNWQVSRVAAGDYMQQVSFLGEFSESFNSMIQQLKEREETMLENNRLTKELAYRQMNLLEYELENQIDHYQQFSKSMEDIQGYRHDMCNHLLCIDSLLQDQDIEEARAYIQSISASFTPLVIPTYGENFIFNALLKEKIGKAEAMNIIVETEIRLDQKLDIENKDWCILFGNLLDNALEALEKVPPAQRYLYIYTVEYKHTLSVTIKNTCIHTILDTTQLPPTSKKDTKNHGVGLKNVEDCVCKYNGEMQFESKENIFSLTFILFDI